MNWDKIEGADEYEIYRLASYSNRYKLIGNTKTDVCTFSDNTAQKGVNYTYVVVPIEKTAKGTAYNLSVMAKGEVKLNVKLESINIITPPSNTHGVSG